MRWITGYEPVSMARQGASGLGIEAQRQAVDGFVEQKKGTLLARFTEVERGRNPDRPELGKALHLARVTGETLVIPKLDRLSRNAALTSRPPLQTSCWPDGTRSVAPDAAGQTDIRRRTSVSSSSSGVPASTIRPRSITAMRLASSTAKSKNCSTSTMAICPWSRR